MLLSHALHLVLRWQLLLRQSLAFRVLHHQKRSKQCASAGRNLCQILLAVLLQSLYKNQGEDDLTLHLACGAAASGAQLLVWQLGDSQHMQQKPCASVRDCV